MKKLITTTIAILSLLFMIACGSSPKKAVEKEVATRWSVEKAKEWGNNQPWLVGANFNPSTAINQLETWQAETFDTEIIDRELGWAENIGMNTMRVYLHHVVWQEDKDGFKNRIDQFLNIAQQHGIKPLFVFFDDCWNPVYKAGKQPDPKPGVHNSGWVQDPGTLLYEDSTLIDVLEVYVKDILTTFKDDNRILLWDLYNEPGNSGYGNRSMPLLKKVFQWGREVNPSQPLTVGVWLRDLTDLNKFQLEHSDIITYHNYEGPESHQATIDSLKLLNRPMICTEYMARRNNSLFTNILPILAKENVGAINWGLVDGKSNTKYAWDEPIADGSEPKLWFHEVFRKDGSPYKQEEVDIIKKLTAEKNSNWSMEVRGKRTNLFTLKNRNGITVTITNYGGKVVTLDVPDKNGKFEDIVLGYDNIKQTVNGNLYFGALIGRYGNRIAKGKFSIDGTEYTLVTNNGPNALHGGKIGYNDVVFDAEQDGNKLTLKHLDPDMFEGYPGNLDVTITYELTDDNELKITYDATTDKPTIINLTHHSFFNLHGAGNGTINNHKLFINADKYTPIDATLIPTGELADVKGTPFDFTKLKEIGKDVNDDNTILKNGNGYDHNFVLNGENGAMKIAAKVIEPQSGRVMEVFTTEPGLQFYGGNFLDGSDVGKGGKKYGFRTAFCLESQHYPDSPNHPGFPTTILRPGEKYHTETIYKFSIN